MVDDKAQTRCPAFRSRMLSRDILGGTFLKTPAYELIEVLALSGLDFICLDAEHAPFDRARLDACLALTNALDFPALVRVPSAEPQYLLAALDSGATGVVVPHIDTVEKAKAIARAGRFGHGGRGYAGSTRWAGFASRTMPDVLEKSSETVVIAQIEEPEGVDAAADIAAIDGIDGLFVGPADLAVCLGKTSMADAAVREAIRLTADAANHADKACMTFVPDMAVAAELRELGISMFFVGSEHSFMLSGARQTVDGMQALAAAK